MVGPCREFRCIPRKARGTHRWWRRGPAGGCVDPSWQRTSSAGKRNQGAATTSSAGENYMYRIELRRPHKGDLPCATGLPRRFHEILIHIGGRWGGRGLAKRVN